MAGEDIAVTRFREYLRIKTVHPEPDYAGAAVWLENYARELGIPSRIVYAVPDYPTVIMTLEGSSPELPSVFLYSHVDVVPVFPDKWTHDPFSAFKDENGNIYARGAQDMKCIGIQLPPPPPSPSPPGSNVGKLRYMEALRRLKAKKAQLTRTIHIVWGPEEEVMGILGMAKFVETEEFRALNVGFALDEGLASEDDVYRVFYGERSAWWIRVRCKGNPGHGSKFIPNAPGEKIEKVLSSFLSFRESERKRLEGDPALTIGDVISVNLTKLEGGVQMNVVPAELSAFFDIRVPPSVNPEELKAKLEGFCKDAGSDVTLEFINYYFIPTTATTNETSPWWRAFKGSLDTLSLPINLEIFTGGTDARYLRQKGIEALGFSPMIRTPILLHDHNEFLSEETFLNGVHIYETIIPNMANVPSF